MVLIKSIIDITDYAEVQIKVFLYSCPQIVSEDPLKISGRLCIYQFPIVKGFS